MFSLKHLTTEGICGGEQKNGRRQTTLRVIGGYLSPPFLNKIIESLIKQRCHFTLYCSPRAGEEDSFIFLPNVHLGYISAAAAATEATHSLLKLKMFLANAAFYHRFRVPKQRSSRLLMGSSGAPLSQAFYLETGSTDAFIWGVEIQISLLRGPVYFFFSLTFKHTLSQWRPPPAEGSSGPQAAGEKQKSH